MPDYNKDVLTTIAKNKRKESSCFSVSKSYCLCVFQIWPNKRHYPLEKLLVAVP